MEETRNDLQAKLVELNQQKIETQRLNELVNELQTEKNNLNGRCNRMENDLQELQDEVNNHGYEKTAL